MPHIPSFADTVNVYPKHHLLAVLQNPCAPVVGLHFNTFFFFFSLKPGSPPIPGEQVHMVKEERITVTVVLLLFSPSWGTAPQQSIPTQQGTKRGFL